MPEAAFGQTETRMRGGLRGVLTGSDTQPCFNIVASPTASYLLPDMLPALEQVSFGADETRELGGVLLVGDSMIVGRSVREDDLLEQHRWNELKDSFERMSSAVHIISARTSPVRTIARAARQVANPPKRRPRPALAETRPRALDPLPADASIQTLATRLRELTGFSDARLADLFKVTRETYNRWRLGAMTNPTDGARRRVVTVTRLLEELESRDVSVPDWLQNPTAVDGLTPYDLIVRGRVDEAAYLAASTGEDTSVMRRDRLDEEPFILEDDEEGWQTFDIEVSDED